MQQKNKRVLLTELAQHKMIEGINTVANVVKTTLGPGGQNVCLQHDNGVAIITKDGVTVARMIKLEDPAQDCGAQFLRRVAGKANSSAGDGTTTATVLAQAMIAKGMEELKNGKKGISIKKSLDKAVEKVVEFVQSHSEEVGSDLDKVLNVATISANGDREVAELVVEAYKKASLQGVVSVEQHTGENSFVDSVYGMQIDSGYASPYLRTNLERGTSELEKPLILVADQALNSIQDLLPLLTYAHKDQGQPLVLIAHSFSAPVMNSLIKNRLEINMQVLAINAPYAGALRTEFLHDVCTMTGATLIGHSLGVKQAKRSHLGLCEKIIATGKDSIISSGYGEVNAIDKRAAQLRHEARGEKDEKKKAFWLKRAAKLTGGVSAIKVGATTTTEGKELKDRVEDAIHATRAALEAGVVPGGGLLLMRASAMIDQANSIGEAILSYALVQPLKTIVDNAGYDAEDICKHLQENTKGSEGFDARVGDFCNLREDGIIDPTRVVLSSLRAAASIAGMILSTGGAVVNLE